MTIILCAGLLVPFVLITDIFPFMRFGMFAEPITRSVQTEKFVIYQLDATGNKNLLHPERIGINPNTFYYLCRNYFYRNEAELFSKKLLQLSDQQTSAVELLHLVKQDNGKTDTLYVHTFAR
ncbi:MAG TPA: hypothetical protein VNB90_07965 [Cytophagaceae bacterium]|jgi:hypothetical protein|nr:hypothetical protein [Cytophagaceae bacterium]